MVNCQRVGMHGVPVADRGKIAAFRGDVAADGMPVVSIEDVKVHFPLARRSTLHAIDGVSLQVFEGEVLGIIGESGSGKSTLGRTIVGLQKLTAGRILCDGVDLGQLRGKQLRERRRGYQIVFQDPDGALNPRLTVLQSVREPLDIEGQGTQDERNRTALACLDQVGLGPDFANRYPHQLSGGQKQRAIIARVLTMRPRMLVCDEAVAALDVSIQADIINLFAALRQKLGLTYVFISHDLNIVAHLGSRIAVMYLGVVVELAPVEELLGKPLHPYTLSLLQSRPDPVPASMRTTQRKTLKGEIPSALAPPSGCRFRTRCPRAETLCGEKVPRWDNPAPGRWVACHFAGDHRSKEVSNDRT
jgi:oligopeptide/dipeptide ABC transporter ATP-binding protein